MDKTIWADNVELQAVEIKINGKKQWRWIATNFEGETYKNGVAVDVYTYANTLNKLFQ